MKKEELLRSLTQLSQFDPLQLIFYEELARELKERKIKTEVPSIATKIIDKRNIIVKDLYTFLELEGRGTIHEVLLISDSPEFRVLIDLDNSIFDWSYKELLELSPYIDAITAVQTNGQYIFRLNSVSFISVFSLRISAKRVTFTKAYAKFDLCR